MDGTKTAIYFETFLKI